MSDDGIFEALLPFGSFQPISGGHVYKLPNRWLFGRQDRYSVNEIQRTEILTLIRSTRWSFAAIACISAFAVGTMIGVAPKLWLERAGYQDLSDAWSWVVAILSIYAGLLVAQQWFRSRLRPIIATLRPANGQTASAS